MNDKYLFHIHSWRCHHAENISDEAYIKRAIELEAESIWFSDHAPFPGNPFGNRMAYEQLPEYLSTLRNLKEQYRKKINVHIGLEIEYFPSFDRSGYYWQLRENPDLDFLLLGQHMAELEQNQAAYSFEMSREWLIKNEFISLGEAEVRGMQTGYFDYIAHPDRIYRRCKSWTHEMQIIGKQIIATASEKSIPLEQNEVSKRQKSYYWSQFWQMTDHKTQIVHGLDAHALNELKLV